MGLLDNSFVPAVMLPPGGSYGDRLAPYVENPAAGKTRLEGEIAHLKSRLGGITPGTSADQDRMYTTYRDTIRDYGMMLQDVNARIARPDLGPLGPGTGGIDYGAQAEANAAKLHRKNAKKQWKAPPTVAGTTDNNLKPATNLLPPTPLPPALPPVTGTITDAYRRPRGLLQPRV